MNRTRLWLPGYLPSANRSLRGDPKNLTWIRKKERTEASRALGQALACHLAEHGRPVRPFPGALVLGFERRTIRLMDVRNLSAAYKALEDAIVGAGLIVDDSPDIVIASPCRQVRVSKRAHQGTLVVLALDSPEWAEARNTIHRIFE